MKVRWYWVLLAVESVCAAAVLYSGVPLYRALLKGPGPDEPAHEVLLKTTIAVLVMQACYWSKRRIRPAGLKRHVFLAHLLMFTSRLGFVFAGSLFSLVVFVRSGDTRLSAYGIAVLLAFVFAQFCFGRELEALAAAFETRPRDPNRGEAAVH